MQRFGGGMGLGGGAAAPQNASMGDPEVGKVYEAGNLAQL